MAPTRIRMILVGLAFATFVVGASAWVGDDAFITMRTVHNALEGHGLRFNVVERVQAFTHPLWMLVLLVSHAVVTDPWYAAAVPGFLTSVGALAWLLSTCRDERNLWLVVLGFTGSKALVDYATSGLENPLSHLLLLAMFLSVRRGGAGWTDLLRSTLIFALGLTNRLDALVLLGPLWLLHAGRSPRTIRHVGAVLVGMLPIVLWEVFALVYYGSLVPNTAYAKLGAQLPRGEVLAQGLRYVRHPFTNDPVTALGLLALPTLTFLRKQAEERALLVGGMLHVAYVVWVGGDFMAGRFLTPALFATLIVLALPELGPRTFVGAAVLLFGSSAVMPSSPFWSGRTYERQAPWAGIVDERGFYFSGASWMGSKNPGYDLPFAKRGRQARQAGRPLVTRAAAGYFGYFAGPDVHILDPLALTDPLLARLPARYDPNWRVGHYRRPVIPGYAPDEGRAPDDPALRPLHDRVARLSRGPLLDPGRWLDGLLLQMRPPVVRFDRFADAEPLQPGRFAVRKAGACMDLDGASPMSVQVDAPIHAVFTRDGEPVLPHRTSGAISTPAESVDRLCLFPGKRLRERQVQRGVLRVGTLPP